MRVVCVVSMLQQLTFEQRLQRQHACAQLLTVANEPRHGARLDRINESLTVFADACKALDTARGAKLTAEAKRLIARVHISNQMQRLEARKTQKVRHGTVSKSIYKITAEMCGVSERTVSRIWAEYCTGKLLVGYKPPPTAAVSAAAEQNSRIRRHQGVVDSVREFVHASHRGGIQVTSVDVTQHLVEAGELKADLSAKKEVDAAVRCVQRWLVKHGWQVGKKNGRAKMMETDTLREARALYLRTVKQNRKGEKRREVFIGDTFFYQHNQPVSNQAQGARGDRYGVIGCILGPDLTKSEEQRQDTFADQGGWYTKAYTKIHAPLGRSKACPACFDSDRFERWFRDACASLHADGFKCIFYMDSVPHHKATDFPRLKTIGKEDLLAQLKSEYVRRELSPAFWDRFATKKALLQFMSSLPAVTRTRVQRIAETCGHKVMYVPSHHCDLQPIHMVWAYAKDKVASKHRHGITMVAHMDEVLGTIPVHTVCGWYKAMLAAEERAWEYVRDAAKEEAESDGDGR